MLSFYAPFHLLFSGRSFQRVSFSFNHHVSVIFLTSGWSYDVMMHMLFAFPTQGDEMIFRAYRHNLPTGLEKWDVLAARAPAVPLLHLAVEHSSG